MKKICLHLAVIVSLFVVPLLLVHEASAIALPSNIRAVTTAASTSHITITELSTKAKLSWPYYVTRASGLTAAFLLLLLILSGIGQVTGLTYRFIEPLIAWSFHRALAISLGVCILIHGGSLLFDRFVAFSVRQVLIPFAYRGDQVVIHGIHLGSLYVAFGIIAFYIAAILIVSSLLWSNKKPRLWRILHYLSYILVILVFLHALFLGIDIAHGTLHTIWWVGGIIIGIGILSRLRRVGTIKKDDLPQ
jgi:sulfoxide reductase heme-binding subunit YedZ